MADRRQLENRFGYISAPYSKFRRSKQNQYTHRGDITKIANFENSRWRTVAILKMVLKMVRTNSVLDIRMDPYE